MEPSSTISKPLWPIRPNIIIADDKQSALPLLFLIQNYFNRLSYGEVGNRLIDKIGNGKHQITIYRNELKIWDFGFEKASGLNDRKSPHISNIR